MAAKDLFCEERPTLSPGFQQQDAIAQACCQDWVGFHVDGDFTEILKCGCSLWFINSFSHKW